MREHDYNDSLKITTQSVCVTVYSVLGSTRLLVVLRAIIEYRHASIAAGRGAGVSVIQVCTLQMPAIGKRVKAYRG